MGDPVTATDMGETRMEVLTHTLGGTDAASFTIDSRTGQIKVNASLDHETEDTYTVTVTATDPSGLKDEIPVTINVTDVDETPSFTAGSTAVTFVENTAITTEVESYSATDPEDNGQNLWRGR